MFSRSPAAANRMMRALCVCDTGIMRTAVRRYVDGLLDAELETLLHRSLNELDSYHRMLLELGLSAGTFSASGEPWELRRMFADFFSENPRALEQLSPAIIEGVLRQAAIADPSLAREFLMPSLKSNQWFTGGVAGALCAALISLAYLQFNASGNVPAVAVAPSFSTGAYERRPSVPAVTSAAIRHRRRLAHAVTRSHGYLLEFPNPPRCTSGGRHRIPTELCAWRAFARALFEHRLPIVWESQKTLCGASLHCLPSLIYPAV